jgi:small subunit ribosomal protein S27
MRVPYVRNPHYDDHFDLTDEDLLLGKTLNFVGRLQNDIIGRSSQVIGWAKYQKFDKALALMKQYLEASEESSITENVVRYIFLSHSSSLFRKLLCRMLYP